MIQTAFKDGILSDDERTLIDELVEQLDMSTIGLKQIIDEVGWHKFHSGTHGY